MKRNALTKSAAMIMLALALSSAALAQAPEMVVRNLYKAAESKEVWQMSKAELRRYFAEDLTSLIFKAAKGGKNPVEVLHTSGRQVTKFRVKRIQPQTAVESFIQVSYNIGSFGDVRNTMPVRDIFELSNFDGKGWRIFEMTSTGYGLPDEEEVLTKTLEEIISEGVE